MADRRIGIIGGSGPFLSYERLINGKIKETEQLIKELKNGEERIDLNPKPKKDCSKGHRYIKKGSKDHNEIWKCKYCDMEL